VLYICGSERATLFILAAISAFYHLWLLGGGSFRGYHPLIVV